MSQYEKAWFPEQNQLYVVTSLRNNKRKEIAVFPCIRRFGQYIQLCFRNSGSHVLNGRIESVSGTAASFVWEHDGESERLDIRPLTGDDFFSICEQRRKNRWSAPNSVDELFSWYTGLPSMSI